MVFQTILLGAFSTTIVLYSSLIAILKVEAQSPSPVDNTDLISYSKALLRMEPERQQAFEEIKKIIGNGDVPKIVCNDSNSLSGLPGKAKDVAISYCNRSQKIVEENGLTIDRFNKITVEVQNNSDLKKQIYNNLLRLQKSPSAQY
ncbi:DUF4168 domain-containing protein [Aetokthonos hydrillicola Thurmond2011]|jgi:hypothetical protein|uniref:DUF4168 domain-containing protein n=1 Tax=Aetokthonos hydrillicola Thurmond2011 TaxID=2712845 RepID=A0AAP5ICS9_9CYAN|nr:DUF4168 domain-containing protein [Aetokthonos hydrillicola]MBO3463305.1 DUF4168 domain-containing protein [Aetokthonos hydrillicola CCALA 1050]MBW4585708.1 DUF4168 domain-containing protein [Aetokthonos hydrillicola CCALA 1050]MDR9899212.1 DUF4168 domain-containing protein [Aetokthonos hydrillicola Thurmond2011]